MAGDMVQDVLIEDDLVQDDVQDDVVEEVSVGAGNGAADLTGNGDGDHLAERGDGLRIPADDHPATQPELTVDELATRVGVPVRTIRFYAGKRLLPPPRLEGRTGLYGPVHVARLELIRDLQQAGYTLAAIEQFLATLPDDADADAVELFGTLLTPWVPEERIELTLDQLADRLDRDVDDDLLELLERSAVIEVLDGDRVSLTPSQLEFGIRLLELDAPFDALIEAADIIRCHAAALAGELQRVFREKIIARHHDGATPEDRARLRALAAGLRPLTVQSIVAAYQEALDREVRAQTVT